MNKVISVKKDSLQSLSLNEDELMNVLRNSLYPGAKDESIKMVISYCRVSNLDVMQKPVHIVPMLVNTGTKDNNGFDVKEFRDVIMPGIGLYRTQASRSGECAGISEPEFGDDVTELLGNTTLTFPKWCKVTVKRQMANSAIVEFSAKEFWKENYAAKSAKVDDPNSMWKRRPYAQLAKCFDETTEILTTDGFQLFSEVTGKIIQMTPLGLKTTDSIPFVQDYDGEMINAEGTRLNFCVTPNHTMITTDGKIEADILYNHATKCAIPLTAALSHDEHDISDNILRLSGYILADGTHTGYNQFRIAVSRFYKINSLNEINLHSHKGIRIDAGREVVIGNRTIKTNHATESFSYDYALISNFIGIDKLVNHEWILSLSSRQAKIVVDALVEFDGSFNGTVRRLYQNNKNVIRAFELLSVHAGYSITNGTKQKSEIGNCSMFTLSESKQLTVIRGSETNKASLKKVKNTSGKVWCVTVDSGVIIVRRNGLSMVCGNCAEAQALRKAFPEVGAQPTADEMEGKDEYIDSTTGEVVISKKIEKPTLDYCSDEKFKENSEAWRNIILSRKKTPDSLIATLNTKYLLTDDQKLNIDSWSHEND